MCVCVCVRVCVCVCVCVCALRVLRLCSCNLAGRLMGPREMRDILTMKKSNTHHASVQNWTDAYCRICHSQVCKDTVEPNLTIAGFCTAAPL